MRTLVRTILAVLILTLVSSAGLLEIDLTKAQTTASVNLIRPFEPSEELFYEAEFSRSLLRKLDVADFKFRASQTFLGDASKQPDNISGPRPYSLSLSAEVASKGFFTRLFNLNFHELVESTVDPLSFTVQRSTIHDQQGKRVRMTETTFDREKGKVLWSQRDPNNPTREPRKVETAFSGQLQDILSAIYFIRTQHLEVGKSFAISITDGGRVYEIPVRVVERKRMKTVLGRINVIRVEPDLFGPDRLIDQEKGEFTMWVTDDSRRVPVGGRIKTDYGTFDIKLKRVVFSQPA